MPVQCSRTVPSVQCIYLKSTVWNTGDRLCVKYQAVPGARASACLSQRRNIESQDADTTRHERSFSLYLCRRCGVTLEVGQLLPLGRRFEKPCHNETRVVEDALDVDVLRRSPAGYAVFHRICGEYTTEGVKVIGERDLFAFSPEYYEARRELDDIRHTMENFRTVECETLPSALATVLYTIYH